ncbi:serine/threonine-protein kinase [Lentisphaera profundi]|uniref:non-specific serine/threonine protein kinase n=1 Tax=Lentisphaera profundi TaxID=1658616 RepID=A0ABY7VMU8_9BACT|nr:serine/threonine-protein kinase [Lentisphaera profundi]WDE95373.1 serine/threonine-protein kinase [Lentisphaera profundi]
MEGYRTTALSDNELKRFEDGLAKCMKCHEWCDMEGYEPLQEYECQNCGENVFMPMRITEFWLYSVTGEGGMGRVYMAQKYEDSKLYAIKLSEYTDECDFRFQSLLYEGDVVMSFEHPHIAKAYRFGYKSGSAFLLMDYVPGYTLEQIAKGFEFSEVELYSWMMQLVDALRYMANMGFIYRDLKPQNVIVRGANLTLVDFGLAIHKEQQEIDDDNLIGSPSYIPPERIKGIAEDERSDMYALGMVFYYVVNGQNYFDGPNEEIVEGHMHPYRYPIQELNDYLPESLCILIDNLIAHEMEDRYQTYDELYNDITMLHAEALAAEAKEEQEV